MTRCVIWRSLIKFPKAKETLSNKLRYNTSLVRRFWLHSLIKPSWKNLFKSSENTFWYISEKGAVSTAEEIWTIQNTHFALIPITDMMGCVLQSHGKIRIFFNTNKGFCNKLQLSETRKRLFFYWNRRKIIWILKVKAGCCFNYSFGGSMERIYK